MIKIKRVDIFTSLKKIGLKKNDSVFITSSLGSFGFPQNKSKNQLLTLSKWLMQSLLSIIGDKGNIFVPTYTYSFTKKKKNLFIKK